MASEETTYFTTDTVKREKAAATSLASMIGEFLITGILYATSCSHSLLYHLNAYSLACDNLDNAYYALFDINGMTFI